MGSDVDAADPRHVDFVQKTALGFSFGCLLGFSAGIWETRHDRVGTNSPERLRRLVWGTSKGGLQIGGLVAGYHGSKLLMSSLRETEDLLNDTSAGFFVGGAIGLKGGGARGALAGSAFGGVLGLLCGAATHGLATIAEGLRPEGEKKADVEARKAEIKRLREGAVDRLIADLEGQAAEMVRMAEDKEAAAKALAAEAARSTKPLGNEPEIQQSGWWRWLSWKRVN